MSSNTIAVASNKRKRCDGKLAPKSTDRKPECYEGSPCAGAGAGDDLEPQFKATKNMIKNEELPRKFHSNIALMRDKVRELKEELAATKTAMVAEMENLKSDMEVIGRSGVSRNLATNDARETADTRKSRHLEQRKENLLGWKYSAKPIPLTYWSSQWNDDYAETANDLEVLMKEYTHKMMLGWSSYKKNSWLRPGDISLAAGSAHLGDEEFFHHDDILHQHWAEFASSISQYQYSLECIEDECNTRLSVANIQLRLPVTNLLGQALVVTHFKSISFYNNDFDREGIKFALEAIKCNPKLEDFAMEKNFIEYNDDVKNLCDIISIHPTLTSIELTNCIRGEVVGYEALTSIMIAAQKKLDKLKFNCNLGYGKEGRQNFLRALSKSSLRRLSLWGNELDDEDARLIAGSLQQNENLNELVLNANNISDECFDEIHEKMTINSLSLNGTSGCNHVLKALIGNGEPYYQLGDGRNWSFKPGVIRKRKIFFVLSKRNREGSSNVELLEDLPLTLLPDALFTITDCYNTLLQSNDELQSNNEFRDSFADHEEDDNEVPALSVIYEILRGWDKVLALYETLGNEQKRNSKEVKAKK